MSNPVIERFGTTRRYSDVVVHASTIYLVEVPATLGADITTQTQEVLASVEQLLKKAGSDKSRLLIVTLYLRDMADYNAMNTVWDAWVPEGTAPTDLQEVVPVGIEQRQFARLQAVQLPPMRAAAILQENRLDEFEQEVVVILVVAMDGDRPARTALER